ncbi:MAG: hypothetical protein II312_00655 [Lachnospiraceae bacterium]|nr:hypothetical protein [Lachnospiraceae bacterium]MEE0919889.1 hypothetical protein [Lachnospiraceae bacterium]
MKIWIRKGWLSDEKKICIDGWNLYNMESDETLHLISKFETYQQTTEYTCGCAAAIMTLNHFGENAYDEMQK